MRRLDLAQNFVAIRQTNDAAAQDFGDKIRQGFQRRARTAITVDQLTKSARTNILAANETKPIDKLRHRAARRALFRSSLLSNPPLFSGD